MAEGITITLITGLFGLVTIILNYFLAKKKKSEKENSVRLVNHPSFSKIELYINQVNTTLILESKGKEKVFKDVITNHLRAYESVLHDLALELDAAPYIDTSVLSIKCHEALQEIIQIHLNYYKDSSGYTKKDKEVLAIVIEKYDMWNAGKINFLVDTMESTCCSNFYSSSLTKGAAVLDLYMVAIISTVNDAYKTIGSINGDLKGLVFKGTTI